MLFVFVSVRVCFVCVRVLFVCVSVLVCSVFSYRRD